MAVIKATNPKVSTLKQGVKYITNPEKAELITGKDCIAETALEEMQATKELYNKTEGRQYMHFVQSFKPDDPLDPSQAHHIGLEMARKHFKGYEVLVATHTDKGHLHNHLIVNSVSFENGAKIQHSKNDLKAIKELSDQICEREGLHVIREKTPGKDLGRNEYQVAIKGESWKFKTMAAIDQTMERTQNKEEFVKAMEAQGYQVKWTAGRKHITYTTPEGDKVRDNKLHDPKYLKEAMEKEFQLSKAQPSAPISEPTLKIVQQPRTLEQVKHEVKSAKAEVNKAHEEIGGDVSARNKAHEGIGEDLTIGSLTLKQTAAPISEPTRVPIVQQSQPKTLESVRKEANNEIRSLSIDEWKKEISQVKKGGAQNKAVQSQTFQELKMDYDRARTEWGRQHEAIDKIKSQLDSEKSKWDRYKDLEKEISDVEKKLGKLSRFNPLNRSDIKTLKQKKESLIKKMQTDFGETTQEHIEQRITQLNKEKQSKENKLPELNTRHKQTKDAFDQRHTELKALNRQKDLDKSKDLLERYKAGEKLNTQDTKLINSFSKELNIKKIPISRDIELGDR